MTEALQARPEFKQVFWPPLTGLVLASPASAPKWQTAQFIAELGGQPQPARPRLPPPICDPHATDPARRCCDPVRATPLEHLWVMVGGWSTPSTAWGERKRDFFAFFLLLFFLAKFAFCFQASFQLSAGKTFFSLEKFFSSPIFPETKIL